VNKADLKLDWCSHDAAKYAVEHWHYSKSMPMPPTIRIGVWECDQFIGCVVFARGASPHLGAAYGLQQTEVAELTRVAITAHIVPVSRILTIAVAMLRRKESGLRLIVSFADTNEGHHGGIYQGAGWMYCGKTSSKNDYISADGRRYRDRQVTASGYARQFGVMTHVPKVRDCIAIPLEGKYRYLYPLDDSMKEQIASLSKPYPKRPKDSSEPPAIHAGEGGAAPTRTLQNLFPLRDRMARLLE